MSSRPSVAAASAGRAVRRHVSTIVAHKIRIANFPVSRTAQKTHFATAYRSGGRNTGVSVVFALSLTEDKSFHLIGGLTHRMKTSRLISAGFLLLVIFSVRPIGA